MSFFKKSFVLIAMGVVVAFVCWANRTKAVVKLPPKRRKQTHLPVFFRLFRTPVTKPRLCHGVTDCLVDPAGNNCLLSCNPESEI
jgi:hypothetical protein